ncbi:MAG: transglycosylase domain-containing protein [Propionicimonas sp.]|uniref:transglycosylase domain-containing protein n=1 Tax=Propionicimonas sp. TaxID=1955623 RepID=UPI003D0EF80C
MRMGRRLYSLLMFAVVSVLGGLLTAGLVVPIAGIATTAGTSAVTSLDSLPTALKETPQWERSRLLNADGTVLAYFYDENRIYEPLSKISLVMQQAQVAIEDHRFYEHGAMDLQGTLRALVSTSQGNTQGGSSLTQQYVRLVLVEQAEENNDAAAKAAATENTVARKVRELRYAIAVEKQFTKDEILERYLNIAYYGDGAYGVEAAARHYFGVSAADLDLPQAAMLAGLVRNPVASNPRTHTQVGVQRRNDVLDRMAELNVITADQAAEAKATKFDVKKVTFSRKGCANSKLPFICDYALEVLKQQATSLGTTEEERLERVYRGGLTITTEIDPKAQKAAQKVVSRNVDPRDPAIGVVVMMDPKTGLIKAMAQSRPEMGKKKGQTYYNYAVGTGFNGADGFQGGSTFKMFVAAAALENGFGVQTSFHVRASKNYQGETFQSCSGSFKVLKRWVVDGPEVGNYNMYNGTAQSVNNYYVPLEQKVGLCKVTKLAKRVGLQLASGEDIVEKFNAIPSFTLGSAEITPLSMITAYGTMANRGTKCNPVILKSITNADGGKYDVPSAGCKQVVDPEIADAVNKVFQGPFTSGTLRYAQIPGYTLAGKTGTVPLNKAEWSVGYTPNLVAAAVISYDNSPKYKKYWNSKYSYLRNVRLPHSGTYLTGYGADAGSKMLKPAMQQALADIDEHDEFATAQASVLNGDTESVPSCSGMGWSSCRAALSSAGFSSYVTYQYSDTVAKGGLIGLTRSGSVPKGSEIGVIVSKGPKPEPKPTSSPTPSTEPTRKPRR